MCMKHAAAVAATLIAIVPALSPVQEAALAHEHEDGGRHALPDAATVGEPGRTEDAARTVAVSVFDYYFEPERLTVAAGETVRFTVANQSDSVHEFSIGTPAMHAAHREEMAMMVDHGVIDVDRINHHMMGSDMGGGHVMSHDGPNAVLLEPGENGEVVWTFSGTASLEFACNLPGHYETGMVGEVEVASVHDTPRRGAAAAEAEAGQ